MRIFFIVDDALFFLPYWTNKVIAGLDKEDKVIGITPLITRGKPTFYSHLTKMFFKLTPSTIVKMSYLSGMIILKRLLFWLGVSKNPISLSQVAKKYKTKIFKAFNVNSPEYLDKLEKSKPDIIISSCSQIFHERLLKLAKIACINRHSALLPSYKGVYPIFWAMLAGEKQIGVTVHLMTADIDSGSIIYQIPFRINKRHSLFYLYERAYRESVKATLEAIQTIKHNKKPHIIKGHPSSYYSFPKEENWDSFWEKGLKFI